MLRSLQDNSLSYNGLHIISKIDLGLIYGKFGIAL